jgi:hypothetical protein
MFVKKYPNIQFWADRHPSAPAAAGLVLHLGVAVNPATANLVLQQALP